MVGQIVSHYRIVELIGSGGMGEVYEAEDTQLGRRVALKFLASELTHDLGAVARFQREARAASALDHPNICTIYGIGEYKGRPFIIMQFLEGKTLTNFIGGRPMENEQILQVATQIAEAVAAAHRQGIVHCDLKPSNVFVTERSQVKVLDFGLARVPRHVSDQSPTDSATKTGVTPGTLPYMAPEQLRGKPVDGRTDIYAFGATLYEMATGQRAFREELGTALISDILHQQPFPPGRLNPSLTPRLEAIILKCLEKDPEKRPQSALDLLADLRRAAEPAPSREKSVVVLYFENLSGSKEDEYLRDGTTEDIITELSKIRTLRVFPRSAVLAYRDKSVTAPVVGCQLGAAYVLGGTLRHEGKRLRITAQLVDSHTGHSVWADRYDRQLADVFEVQDEIARSISQALRITLSPQEEEAIAHKPTESHQAYDYYLRGRSHARRCTRADLRIAIQMYEHAIAIDPAFALAYAGLGVACALFYEWHEKDLSWFEKATAASERALQLEPHLPEALAAHARICWSQQKYEEAIEYARQAVARKPDCENAYWTLGQACFASDRWEEAAALAERAIEAAGADYNVHIPYMLALERLGRDQAGRDLRRRHIQALEHHVETVPEDVRAHILLASDHAFVGSAEQAIRHLNIAVGLQPSDSNILYNAACTYGILKRSEEALATLEQAIAAGFGALDYAARDPDLTCVHNHPQFQRLLEDGRRRTPAT